MAFQDRKGNKFTNRDTMKQSERSMASRGPKIGSETALEEPDGGHEGAEDPHQVVAEHGPAANVEIDHTAGHEVHSTHGDGHQHHSQHGSAKEAHQHGMCLSGDCDCGGGAQM